MWVTFGHDRTYNPVTKQASSGDFEVTLQFEGTPDIDQVTAMVRSAVAKTTRSQPAWFTSDDPSTRDVLCAIWGVPEGP